MGTQNSNTRRLTVKEWEYFSGIGGCSSNGLLHHDKDGVIITNGHVLLLLDISNLPAKFGNCVPVYQSVDGSENWSVRKPKPMGAIGPFVFAPDGKFVEMKPALSKCDFPVTFETWSNRKKITFLPMSALDSHEDIFAVVNRHYYDVMKRIFPEVKFWADKTQEQVWSGTREVRKPLYVTADGEFRAVLMPMTAYGEFSTVVAICKATAGLRHD